MIRHKYVEWVSGQLSRINIYLTEVWLNFYNDTLNRLCHLLLEARFPFQSKIKFVIADVIYMLDWQVHNFSSKYHERIANYEYKISGCNYAFCDFLHGFEISYLVIW